MALGPRIGYECYEIGEDVRQRFTEEGFSRDFFHPHPARNGKYLFDLKTANLRLLLSQGVKEENIYSVDICTHCHKDFPSYRRDGQKAGRMLSFLGMSS